MLVIVLALGDCCKVFRELEGVLFFCIPWAFSAVANKNWLSVLYNRIDRSGELR